MRHLKYGEIDLKIFETREEMGKVAATEAAKRIKELLKQKEEINCVFAAAPSQNDFLKSLKEDKSIEWNKINAYHMDEYIGFEIGSPHSFSGFLNNTIKFLPIGLIGLVLASMFANTLTMCNSDANTISAVLTRDVLPIIKPELKEMSEKKSLFYARLTTIGFTTLTILVALFRDQLGGVTGLILTWFAALLGPTAIPLLLGLLPQFKYSDSKAAIASIIGGLGVFVLTKMGLTFEADVELIAPLLTSFIIFEGVGLLNKYVLGYKVPDEIENLMIALGSTETIKKEMSA